MCIERDHIIDALIHAFRCVDRPIPLASYVGSHCDEEVDVFNETDWDSATYSDFVDGLEGAIICRPRTKAFLMPYLFKIVILRRHGIHEGAADNLSSILETWPVEKEVEDLLNEEQRRAIVLAWCFLDRTVYSPSGSNVADELARHWMIDFDCSTMLSGDLVARTITQGGPCRDPS